MWSPVRTFQVGQRGCRRRTTNSRVNIVRSPDRWLLCNDCSAEEEQCTYEGGSRTHFRSHCFVWGRRYNDCSWENEEIYKEYCQERKGQFVLKLSFANSSDNNFNFIISYSPRVELPNYWPTNREQFFIMQAGTILARLMNEMRAIWRLQERDTFHWMFSHPRSETLWNCSEGVTQEKRKTAWDTILGPHELERPLNATANAHDRPNCVQC